MTMLSATAIDWQACVREDLVAVQQVFDEELVSASPVVNDLCGFVRAYRGKLLRPTLLLLSAKAAGDISSTHHTLAAVVEMVHMATLVHDDVLDQADERRRQPSLRAMSGNITAVLLGDYLISHAFHLCSSLDSQYASRRIADTANTVCEGEILQNHRRGDDRLTEGEYLEIIARKTGALTAVACELGAHFAGARPRVVQALRGYGMSAGVAFQVVDDVLDITGNQGQMGKAVGLDLGLGKPTLPFIHALAHATHREAAWLRDALAGRSSADRAELQRRLEATGGVEYALAVAARHVRNAVAELERLPPSEARSALAAAAEFIVRRCF
jgi:octaprenyl-diphosphate synthase